MIAAVDPRFVSEVPPTLEPGLLYISVEYRTAAHLCCCGCGLEVVTPLSPTDWAIRFDGIDVSLTPSIGNWEFPCRSHYWISEGRVRWSRGWTDAEVAAGRNRDRAAKEAYYAGHNMPTVNDVEAPEKRPRLLRRIWRKLTKR